ncbi:MAG: heparinase II/III-family protein [Myxococcales bacterium]|nr:heparinase II/III-family protein [Myxococcales bacterium]
MSWHLARARRLHLSEIAPRMAHAVARSLRRPPAAGSQSGRLVPDVDVDPAAVAWAQQVRRDAEHAERTWQPAWDRPSWTLDLLRLGVDPKDLWIHGRLQHLALLAHADPAAPGPVADALHWLSRHPVGRGVHWASTLEVAVRLVSLATLAQIRPCQALRDAIAAHAGWLIHSPSLGSSARNHRVAELAALAVAARALPDSPATSQWLSHGAQLPSVLARQLHPDGVGVEQSTHYLAFVVEWALLARQLGVAGLDPLLQPAIVFLRTLVDGSGVAVSLGDDDGGQVLPTGPSERYVGSVAGAGAALLGQPAPLGWRPDLLSAWLGADRSRPPEEPASMHFVEGGLTVLRRGGTVAVLDHGPVGEPDLSAHGHADACGLWLHLPSGPLVVGRGTGRYTAAPAHRTFHRSVAAHPTLSLDAPAPSVPHDHPFLWRRRTTARSLAEADPLHRAVAEIAWGGGIVHQRQVWLEPERLVWTDQVRGSGAHVLTVQIPLAPGLALTRAGAAYEVGRGDQVLATVHPDPRCATRVITGGPKPGVGWHSPRYGHWVAASTLLLTVRSELPITLRTVVRIR